MVEDEDTFIEAPWREEQTGQTSCWKFGDIGFSKMHVSLSREERQMVLAGTRNDTEYTAIVTQLRSGTTKSSVNETEEARALERAARFILQKPTLNGMLNKFRTASRVMHLNWR